MTRKSNTMRPITSPVYITFFWFLTLGLTASGQVRTTSDVRSSVAQRAAQKTEQKADGLTPIQWNEVVKEVKYDGTERRFLYFEGAIYADGRSLPMYHILRKVGGTNTLRASIADARFEALSPEEEEALNEVEVPSSIEVEVERIVEMKQPKAKITFVPIRKNPTTGQLEKMTAFRLDVRPVPLPRQKSAAASSFSTNSVLASGNWYKLAVSRDGIHRITYDDLVSMGVDVASIDPRRINIYGNGGGMLPQPNDIFRHDDLVQNAIEVTGQADGSFDPSDQIIFFAKGPHRWHQDSTSCGGFRHEVNIYDDRAYYYLTVDRGMGKRVNTVSAPAGSANTTVTTFVDHQFHEEESKNLIKSGRLWVGEEFDIQTTHDFSFGFSNVVPGEPAFVSTRFLGRSGSTTNYSVQVNGNSVSSGVQIPGTSGAYSAHARVGTTCNEVNISSGNTSVTVNYFKGGNASAIGWLDYLEVIAKRQLSMAGGQMAFRDPGSVGAGNISEFRIASANSAVRVWDVTDPTDVFQMPLQPQGATAVFKAATDSLRQFVAFNGSVFYGVEPIGAVPNQNLHGMEQANMIIVAHPDFLSEAERLAEFHRTNQTNPLSVNIVTPEEVYNEYSSGAQDVTAIRDMMRMLYQRSSTPDDYPRYLLLFGDASYDYKDRLSDNTNFVPTYQSVESLVPTSSHASDDYFGFLDPQEGAWTTPNSPDALDVGIGRFVVRTMEDARAVVDKIFRYEEAALIADNGGTDGQHCADDLGTSLSPDWRNRMVFVADDEDNNLHISQSDQISFIVDTMYPEYNHSKIYLDAYVQESTPGGQRYPEVNTAINTEVQRGALLINYTGHGGELGWAHERVLGVNDINDWTNSSNLPVFVTATCEFTRYDDPGRISAGEYVHLNPNGGGIALFTTSRLVFAAPNFTLNKNFFFRMLDEQPWGAPTMGDIIRMTKVQSGGSVNNRNFVLIGDPAQRLSFPFHDVEHLNIEDAQANLSIDTIGALQLVTVSGRVHERNGQPMNDFNGIVYPTVFDKASEVVTLNNDPGSPPFTFSVQKNIIYKGKASVTDGHFQFTFVVPRDISYNFGEGRISYYAEGEGTNASGYFDDFVIGGSNENAVEDEDGPQVGLYLNDESFVFGGTTDESPSLLAIVTDSSGVNTVGNGIGHDITAVVDDNTSSIINLNDFYQADLDSYQSGRVVYPFSNLSEGTHTLKLKVWDVHNNSSEAYTEFVVAESAELALQHVLNYPNPFTTHTQFMFEHNQPCNSLDVQVQVFTVSGKLVKTIHETVLTNGFRNDPISWNGLDDYGQKIGRGVYLYNLKVTTPDGRSAEQIERLVILN